MRRSAIVFLLLTIASCSSSPETPSFPQPSVGNGEVLLEAAAIAAIKPVFVNNLGDGAGAAAYGYALALGTPNSEGWEIDLAESLWAANRLALGLLEGEVEFERFGPDGSLFQGPLSLEGLLDRLGVGVETSSARRISLGAVAEVGGNSDGLLAHPTLRAKDDIVRLAGSLGIDVLADDLGGTALRVKGVRSSAILAELPVVCEKRLPFVGGSVCSRPQIPTRSLTANGGATKLWAAATTGPLGPNPALIPGSSEGGVSWNNNEAQSYAPAMVEIDDGFVLIAEPRSEADLLVLPFTSGMAVSTESFGFGTFAFDFELPLGDGLWPALWLLDAQACENPGRCAGYLTPAYHEIDLLETRGSNSNELFMSVHWWDEQIRSESTQRLIDGLGIGVHTIELDRLPGLLVWRLDGVEVARVAGLNVGQGPHRAAPMRLVANLAVGGSFAGDVLVGRNGEWWGDAKVPSSFPDVGWSHAELVVLDVRFTALG